MDIGLTHSPGPYAFKNSYKPCEVYQWSDEEDLGVSLVFEQHVGAGHPSVWHLSQDLVMALGLIREGTNWVRPQEGYIDVVREVHNDKGELKGFLIRSEFLRDYLAARRLALRVAVYRQRTATLRDASHIAWAATGLVDEQPHDRFKARAFRTTVDGDLLGSVAVLEVWRTDVDEGDEVPVFAEESDQNTDSRSYRFERKGETVIRVNGELWREEWIEPAPRSLRVRGDDPETDIDFIVDGAGVREPSRKLNNEDVGRYLWFNPVSYLHWLACEVLAWSGTPKIPARCGVHLTTRSILASINLGSSTSTPTTSLVFLNGSRGFGLRITFCQTAAYRRNCWRLRCDPARQIRTPQKPSSLVR